MPCAGAVLDDLAEHLGGHLVAEEDLAGQDPPDGDDDLVGGLVLGDVAARAGPQDALRVERLVVHRQHQHHHLRPADADVLDQLDAVGLLERHVHDDDVPARLLDHLQRVPRRLRLAGILQVALLLDQQGQTLPDHRMIVHHHDSRGPRRRTGVLDRPPQHILALVQHDFPLKRNRISPLLPM